MSYLSQLKNREIGFKDFFSQSAAWAARKAGLDDRAVDSVVKAADEATDELIPVVASALYLTIRKSFPMVPEATARAISERVAVSALDQVDTVMSGIGVMIKENN